MSTKTREAFQFDISQTTAYGTTEENGITGQTHIDAFTDVSDSSVFQKDTIPEDNSGTSINFTSLIGKFYRVPPAYSAISGAISFNYNGALRGAWAIVKKTGTIPDFSSSAFILPEEVESRWNASGDNFLKFTYAGSGNTDMVLVELLQPADLSVDPPSAATKALLIDEGNWTDHLYTGVEPSDITEGQIYDASIDGVFFNLRVGTDSNGDLQWYRNRSMPPALVNLNIGSQTLTLSANAATIDLSGGYCMYELDLLTATGAVTINLTNTHPNQDLPIYIKVIQRGTARSISFSSNVEGIKPTAISDVTNELVVIQLKYDGSVYRLTNWYNSGVTVVSAFSEIPNYAWSIPSDERTGWTIDGSNLATAIVVRGAAQDYTITPGSGTGYDAADPDYIKVPSNGEYYDFTTASPTIAAPGTGEFDFFFVVWMNNISGSYNWIKFDSGHIRPIIGGIEVSPAASDFSFETDNQIDVLYAFRITRDANDTLSCKRGVLNAGALEWENAINEISNFTTDLAVLERYGAPRLDQYYIPVMYHAALTGQDEQNAYDLLLVLLTELSA